MRRFALTLAVATLVAVALPAHATNLPPFTLFPGVVPQVGNIAAGTLVATTGPVAYLFGGNTGFLEEDVYVDQSGFLFFVFQADVTAGDIMTVSTATWSNTITMDVWMTPNGGTLQPLGVDRDGIGNVDINFNPTITAGVTSYAVIIYTDSIGYFGGFISLSATPSFQIPGFVAAPVQTPEPATLSMLGLGLMGLGALRRRR